IVFCTCVNLMISIACPGTQRRAQPAELTNAFGQRVAPTGYEVSSDHGDMRIKLIGNQYRTADFMEGHEIADVDVAELKDTHAIQSARQVGERNLNVFDFEMEPLTSVTIDGSGERGCSHNRSCLSEHRSARRYVLFCWLLDQFEQSLPQPHDHMKCLGEEEGKCGRKNPELDRGCNPVADSRRQEFGGDPIDKDRNHRHPAENNQEPDQISQ